MSLFRRKVLHRAALLAACVLTVLGLGVAHTGVAHAASSPPATNLGIWTSAEDSGSYSTVSGQSPGYRLHARSPAVVAVFLAGDPPTGDR